jgi:hypothetical protein
MLYMRQLSLCDKVRRVQLDYIGLRFEAFGCRENLCLIFWIIDLILPTALGPVGFTQPTTEMSNRNIKIIMFLRSKV